MTIRKLFQKLGCYSQHGATTVSIKTLSTMTFGIKTLSTMTFSVMSFSITIKNAILSIKTLSILSKTTLSILSKTTLSTAPAQHNDTQHIDIQQLNENAILSIMTLSLMAKNCYAQCHFCLVSQISLYATCHYAECLYAECCGTLKVLTKNFFHKFLFQHQQDTSPQSWDDGMSVLPLCYQLWPSNKYIMKVS